MAEGKLRIGKVALGRSEARVVAPFTDRTPVARLRAAARAGLAFAEARVDLFEHEEPERALAVVRRVRRILPVLVTVRARAEGGEWRGSEEARRSLYEALLPEADAVDVELAAGIREPVARLAKKLGRPLVLSSHDFEKTPPPAALDRIVARASKAGAGVTKIATLVKSTEDLVTLAGVLTRHRAEKLVIIGMGERGVPSRVLFPFLGSLFTFASLDRGTAPGQLTVEETLAALRNLGARR